MILLQDPDQSMNFYQNIVNVAAIGFVMGKYCSAHKNPVAKTEAIPIPMNAEHTCLKKKGFKSEFRILMLKKHRNVYRK